MSITSSFQEGPLISSGPMSTALPGLGVNVGFELQASVTEGRHKVCAYGIDRTGDRNRLLGCEDVGTAVAPPPDDPEPPGASTSSPIGWLDSSTLTGNTLQIRGWTLDPDTSKSINVHVWVNGQFHSGFRADTHRADVERVHGLGSLHGFNRSLSLYPGSNRVCIYGIDATGDSNGLIKCVTTVVPFDEGSVVTPSGIVLPVIDTRSNSWLVMTPCTNHAELNFSDGTLISQVDIVIDPGHGGSESGASAHGLVEKHLNLDVSRRVEAMLEAQGYTVLTTRYADYRLPLRTRGAVAQSVGAKAFVSIHHNGGATAYRGHPGTMTLYESAFPEARRLGMLLWEEMYNEAKRHPTSWVSSGLTGASTALTPGGSDFFGVHRHTPGIPSVITEWGYLTNSYEAAQLKTSTIKDAEARSIVRALTRFLESSDTGSGNIGSWVRSGSTGTGGTGGCEDPALP